MSYNDSKDVEAVLQQAPTPPALTPSAVSVAPTLSSLQTQPAPLAASPSGVAVPPPSSPPAPIQKQRVASGASAQLVPVSPVQPPVIAPTTQTPLVINGQNAAAQTPATTQPGVLTQS